MKINKAIRPYLAIFVTLLLTGGSFFGCHDSIFEDINKESAIAEDRIKGGVTSFVVFNGRIYVAPANNGVIYRKNESRCRDRGDWDAISCPNTPIFLAVDGSTLYMLTTIFENGSGDTEGINLPTGYYEYTSRSGDSDSWDYVARYDYDQEGTHIPSKYKNQHTKVNTSAGTYSTSTNSNVLYLDNTAVLYADQNDVKVGSWWSIAGTADQLILGTSAGLFHMKIGSTDINDEVAPNDLSTSKSIFSGMTILSLFVAGTRMNSSGAWNCSSQSETDSVIYVFATGAGSAYVSQNGLYSYIPGQGWDSEF